MNILDFAWTWIMRALIVAAVLAVILATMLGIAAALWAWLIEPLILDTLDIQGRTL